MKILDLIVKAQDVLPYLKSLSISERKKSLPALKKLWKEHNKQWRYYNNEGKKSHDELLKALYVCMNKTELFKHFRSYEITQYIMSDVYVYEILPWLQPKWYSEVVNAPRPYYESYFRFLELLEKGYIDTFEPHAIAGSINFLVAEGWWGLDEKNLEPYAQRLEKHPITLDKHIWYLFSHWQSTSIDTQKVKRKAPSFNEKDWKIDYVWDYIFRKYIAEGKIDRLKVLSESLKYNSLWFYDFFVRLAPTDEEALQVQEELFGVLGWIPCLKILKKIVTHDDFEYNVFLDRAEVSFFSTLSRLNPLLVLLENIAKKNPEAHAKVCLKAGELLSIRKEKIQSKAAKIISKYGDPSNEALRNEILLSTDLLLSSSIEILKDFVDLENIAVEDFEITQESVLTDAVPLYQDFDEMLFFINQSLKSKQGLDYILAINLIPKFYKLIDKDSVSKLEPVLIVALKIREFEAVGMLAFYLYYIGHLLLEKYPDVLNTYQKKIIGEGSHYAFLLAHFESNEFYDDLASFGKRNLPSIFIFLASKKILEAGLELDVLSTPTHEVSWIQPSILIQRLNEYEEANFEIAPYDFQLAIERLPYTETPENIQAMVATLKNKEVQDIFQYHYGLVALDKSKIKTHKWWIPSVFKNEEEADLKTFTSIDLLDELGPFDWFFDKKNHIVFAKHKNHRGRIDTLNSNFLMNIQQYHVVDACHLLDNNNFIPKVEREILLFLTPNRPQYYVRNIMDNEDGTPTNDKNGVKIKREGILMAFERLWCRKNHHDMMYLVLATGMLFFDKATKEMSAELWIDRTAKDQIDQEKLGEVFAKLISNDFAPLKRFTDLAVNNLLNVSKNHNKALLVFLESAILHTEKSNIKGLKGLKKLLEVFYEAYSSTSNHVIGDATLQKLECWQSEVKSLQGVVKKIRNDYLQK